MLENRSTLVIADDNPTSRRAVVDHFDTLPEFAVVGEARNGEEAVDLVRALRPNLLILDDVLPCLDGLGVLSSLDPSERPNVLMLMSCSSDSLVQHYRLLGAAYCLLRPVSPTTIASRAAMILNRHISGASEPGLRPLPTVRTVSDLLKRTGVPAHLLGYQYLKDAVQYVLNNSDHLCGMTKELYPAVARIHDTEPSRVERSIRHAIEVAWSRADLNELQRLFGSTINHTRGKPTNSEFVAMLADHLRGIAG